MQESQIRRGTATLLLAALSACETSDVVPWTQPVQSVSTGLWQPRTRVPDARSEVGVAAVDGLAFLLGGFSVSPDTDDHIAPRRIWAYNVARDAWHSAGSLPAGVNHAAVVSIAHKIYVIGGYYEAGRVPSPSVWIYDSRNRVWSRGSNMPTPRGAMAYAVLDGRIHTFGGTVFDKSTLNVSQHRPDSMSNSVGTHEVYDPSRNTWELLPPMPTPRNHHAAATVNGLIVVTGGRAGHDLNLDATEIWNPASGSWRSGAALPTGRSGLAAASLDGWMYVFGGEGTSGTYDTAERYSVVQDQWQKLPAMPTARHGLGAVAIDGAIYVLSGGPEVGLSFGSANERYVP